MNKSQARMIMQLPDDYEWEFIKGKYIAGYSGREMLLYEIVGDELVQRQIMAKESETTKFPYNFIVGVSSSNNVLVYEIVHDDISIYDLSLSKIAIHCLIGEGIQTLNKLMQCSEKDLLKIPSFGRKRLNEVILELKKRGLSLKENK